MKRLGIVLAAVGAWWCVTHLGPTGRLAVADPIRYVPLAGSELFEKVTPGQCLPHIDEIVTHANWSIGVSTGWWGCMGYDDHGTYEIHHDGTVDYTWLGMTRKLELTPGELAEVKMLGRFDCSRPEYEHGTSLAIVVGRPDLEGGVSVSSASPLGERLENVLDDAVERYAAGRRWDLHGDVTLRVRAGRYRVELDDLTLRIRRGHRVVAEQTLDEETYADMIDAIVLGTVPDLDDPPAHGVLRIGEATYPFDLTFWEYGALSPISRLIDGVRT